MTPMQATPRHFAVTVSGSAHDVNLLAETLPLDDVASSAWINPDEDTGRFDLFFDAREHADHAAGELQRCLATELYAGRKFSMLVREIAHEDWAESWKIHFHPMRVSPRLVVRPSWDSIELREGELDIIIDPGMTFGTGLHGSTQGCLQLLDRLAGPSPTGSVLDVGCGSGILSVAAAMLGYREIVGFDNYGESMAIAMENARRNRATCRFLESDISEFVAEAPYDVVLANVLTGVLCRHAPQVSAYVTTEGSLVLSGILTEQYHSVVTSYAEQGFAECDRAVIGEWTSGCFRR